MTLDTHVHEHFSGYQTRKSILPLHHISSTYHFSVTKLLKITSSSFLRFSCLWDAAAALFMSVVCSCLAQHCQPLPSSFLSFLQASGHHIYSHEAALLLARQWSHLGLSLSVSTLSRLKWWPVFLGWACVTVAYSTSLLWVLFIYPQKCECQQVLG